VKHIEYLGLIILENGVSTDPANTTTMLSWPVPTSHINLRGFWGLTGYYRKFVQHYCIIAKPLTTMLQHRQFQWTPTTQLAFETLKTAMATTLVLALPNFEEVFVVETDASDKGVGVVLSQKGHPIAYYSKALGVQNNKLSIYEKEFLAILMAVDRWRCYLHRAPFVIKTNHKSLVNLSDHTLYTDLQKKAMAKLAGLQVKIHYRKGADNKVADALSRVASDLEISAISECTLV
jgi:hypothetical protein